MIGRFLVLALMGAVVGFEIYAIVEAARAEAAVPAAGDEGAAAVQDPEI